MTPIRRGTAQRLGLRQPEPSPAARWPMTVADYVAAWDRAMNGMFIQASKFARKDNR